MKLKLKMETTTKEVINQEVVQMTFQRSELSEF